MINPTLMVMAERDSLMIHLQDLNTNQELLKYKVEAGDPRVPHRLT